MGSENCWVAVGLKIQGWECKCQARDSHLNPSLELWLTCSGGHDWGQGRWGQCVNCQDARKVLGTLTNWRSMLPFPRVFKFKLYKNCTVCELKVRAQASGPGPGHKVHFSESVCEVQQQRPAITWMGMNSTHTDIPTRAVGPTMKKAYTTQTAIRIRMVAGKGQNKAASNKE